MSGRLVELSSSVTLPPASTRLTRSSPTAARWSLAIHRHCHCWGADSGPGRHDERPLVGLGVVHEATPSYSPYEQVGGLPPALDVTRQALGPVPGTADDQAVAVGPFAAARRHGEGMPFAALAADPHELPVRSSSTERDNHDLVGDAEDLAANALDTEPGVRDEREHRHKQPDGGLPEHSDDPGVRRRRRHRLLDDQAGHDRQRRPAAVAVDDLKAVVATVSQLVPRGPGHRQEDRKNRGPDRAGDVSAAGCDHHPRWQTTPSRRSPLPGAAAQGGRSTGAGDTT